MKPLGVLIAIMAISLVAATARADKVTVTGTSTGLGAQTSEGTYGSGFSGILNFTRSATPGANNNYVGSPGLGEAFKAFCLEINQTINVPGGPYTYDVVGLQSAPNPGLPNGNLGSRAADVAKLWAAYYSTAITSNDNAAAFQVAIWEIVHEDSPAGTYNLSAGTFQEGNTTVKGIAQPWLNNLSSLAAQASLVALTSSSVQDLIVAVPLPATANMGLALVLCLGGFGAWRRMKLSQGLA